jgi:hypothetical protein
MTKEQIFQFLFFGSITAIAFFWGIQRGKKFPKN